ncbi:MAG: TetR family transcriptional regulator [Acidobacteriota bacterium]
MIASTASEALESSEPRVRLDHETRQGQIYAAAARIFCDKGYGQASMSDIAAAMGMTKAGIYHHIVSKDELLFGIMSYGMDLFEEMVLDRVSQIRDPVERLRAAIRGHVLLVTRDRPKEVTVVLNESHTLKGEYRELINKRKRCYIRFLEATFNEMIDQGLTQSIDPRVATFAMLGMINWIYQWYRPEGRLKDTELAEFLTDLFLHGVLRKSKSS